MAAGFKGLLELCGVTVSSPVTGVTGAGFLSLLPISAAPSSDIGAERVTEDKWDNNVYLKKQRLNHTTATTGDTICSQQASKDEWVEADGSSTLGDTGSGATYTGDDYKPLFELLATGGEDWDAGDTVTLPTVNCDTGLTGFIKL